MPLFVAPIGLIDYMYCALARYEQPRYTALQILWFTSCQTTSRTQDSLCCHGQCIPAKQGKRCDIYTTCDNMPKVLMHLGVYLQDIHETYDLKVTWRIHTYTWHCMLSHTHTHL